MKVRIVSQTLSAVTDIRRRVFVELLGRFVKVDIINVPPESKTHARIGCYRELG